VSAISAGVPIQLIAGSGMYLAGDGSIILWSAKDSLQLIFVRVEGRRRASRYFPV
jgi:hypothetical protein